MSLFAFGINHRTAPVEFRERVSFAPDVLPDALRALANCNGVGEAAILSTCNRTDMFLDVRDGSGRAAVDWFRDYHSLTPSDVQRYLYTHGADGAVRHMMRVASGLDSMILGEPQILGQVKDAYNAAVTHGTVGHTLGKLFQHSFFVAKQVRTDTSIGSSPVSVAFAAVTLARQIFGELGEQTALLVGAGETIELAARHLKANSLGRLVVANRTVENAHRLAMEFGGYAIGLGEIPTHLAEADIVISSTASTEHIINLEHARSAVVARKHRPVFMVDIAVPRDIEPAVGDLDDVYLYTVDDLQEVVQEGQRSRQEAASQAEEIIDTQVRHFMGWLGTRDVVTTIRAFRESAEEARDVALERARRMLASGRPADEVVGYLANTLTNKLLHTPTVQIRQAGAEGRGELVEAAHVLFELADDPHPEPEE